MELTILMPCLNEALTLERCIYKAKTYLADAGIDGEVLIADNGSSDGSQLLASSAGARLVDVPEKGYGAALIAGIRAAKGRYIIMGDSDESYDFSKLHEFVAKLREGQQLVMGNRFAGGIAKGAMPPLHRYLGNPVLSFVGRLFYRVPIKDFHCGLRGFERQAMLGLGLTSTGMEFASEMVVKARIHNLRIKEVPTTLQPDGRDRPPHLRSWRDGWRHLRFLLIYSPTWLFLYPGLALLLTGILGQLAILSGPLHLGAVSFGIHTLLYSGAASTLGLQLCFMAIACRIGAERNGMLPLSGKLETYQRLFQLEHCLIVGGLMIAAGICLGITSVRMWIDAGLGVLIPEFTMRYAIPSVFMMIAGAQVAMFSFMFSLLNIKTLAIRPLIDEEVRSQFTELST